MRGAGGGRPQKPRDQIRHRNKPTKDTITVHVDDRVAEIPEPPLPFTGRRREIWDDMWSQPVATLWDGVDLLPLARLVYLQTSTEAIVNKDLLAEMRHLEDRFLLNPYARAQQRVVIVGDDGEEADGAAQAPARRKSRYGHLRAVPGE